MSNDQQTLHLIIIEDSLNEAEAIVSILRNAGIAVRMHFAESVDQLKELLTPQPCDLVFCASAAVDPTLGQAIQIVQAADPDVPVIATHNEEDPEIRREVLQSGAVDLVTRSDEEHLRLVTQREWDNARMRREMHVCMNALRESERRCHALLDSSRDAITYVHEGMHIYANPVYLDTFGFNSVEDIEGTPIMDMVIDKDHDKLKKYLRLYSKGEKGARELEVTGQRDNGKTFNAIMEFSPASIDGEPCTQIIIRDQSLNKELEKKLKFLSKQDVLTGLLNRQSFMDSLEAEVKLAQKDGQARAVLYMVPDNFRFIKEAVGIAGADSVLIDIASLLRKVAGEDATLARFGDTSFTVLLNLAEVDDVLALANKLRSTIETHIADIEGHSVTCTTSIGVTQFGAKARNAIDVISRADLACELAHKAGGNCVHLHNPVADEKASRERDIHWAKMLENALNHNLFSFVYQPIASLHGDSLERYEVLLRMHDEDGNMVSPAKFIPAAEDNGMILAVDRWVIANAVRVVKERLSAGKDTLLFVKLSSQTITDENLMPWLNEIIRKAKVKASHLVFEAHENMVASILRDAKVFISGLQELGCSFCLEHYGTGPNSVQILKHLHADYIKIDGSFMRHLASNQENQAMVKSIAELAQENNINTIAEFVEDASSLAVLWQCGVGFIQGNFLQHPQEIMDYDFEGGDED